MYSLLKRILFLFPPEEAHYLVMNLLKFILKMPGGSLLLRLVFSNRNENLSKNLAGLFFPNPVGLAAGFDKNALYLKELAALGFGFIEIGTVTPLPQDGNPKPRLFRLTKDEALINRMGFNNDGTDKIAERLKNRPAGLIVGGNIGKNKNTPNENAVDDYIICFQKLFPYVDYFVVNVSSPNTPGLRSLQEKEPLIHILSTLQELNNKKGRKPIFLKIAPDLTNKQLDDVTVIVSKTKITGIIATNTTISRDNLKTSGGEIADIGMGGLSGKPLTQRSTEIINYLRKKLPSETVIIGVGGIHTAADALEKINAGANMVQLYTGFVYEGPGLIKSINRALSKSITG